MDPFKLTLLTKALAKNPTAVSYASFKEAVDSASKKQLQNFKELLTHKELETDTARHVAELLYYLYKYV
jgi:hypothetical protein